MTKFSRPQNSGSNSGPSSLVPVSNTAAPAIATPECINPALLPLDRPVGNLTVPMIGEPVVVDLTLDDDDELEVVSPPVTTTAAEEQLPKEATPPMTSTKPLPQLSPPLPSSTPPTSSPPSPKKPQSFKRNYSWMQASSPLAELPNAKRSRMTAHEGAYRQLYETKAQNSTANHFLGLPAAAATAPAVNWGSAPPPSAVLSGSSSTSAASAKTGKGKMEVVGKKKSGKDVVENKKTLTPKQLTKEKTKKALKMKKLAWKKGAQYIETEESSEEEEDDDDVDDVVQALEDEDEETWRRADKEDNDECAAQIEAMWDEGEDDEAERMADKEDNDQCAASIEAMFGGDEDAETAPQTQMEGSHLIAEEEEEETADYSCELEVDYNPVTGQIPSIPMEHGVTVWSRH
jgi:hypothetical protein